VLIAIDMSPAMPESVQFVIYIRFDI